MKTPSEKRDKFSHAKSDRDIIILLTDLLWQFVLGTHEPTRHMLFEKMRQPDVGDLVIETSTIYHKDADKHRIGILLRTEYRKHRGKLWTLKLQNGKKYTWENASFITVPRSWHWVYSTFEGAT